MAQAASQELVRITRLDDIGKKGQDISKKENKSEGTAQDHNNPSYSKLSIAMFVEEDSVSHILSQDRYTSAYVIPGFES